jgi:hypothetical protein
VLDQGGTDTTEIEALKGEIRALEASLELMNDPEAMALLNDPDPAALVEVSRPGAPRLTTEDIVEALAPAIFEYIFSTGMEEGNDAERREARHVARQLAPDMYALLVQDRTDSIVEIARLNQEIRRLEDEGLSTLEELRDDVFPKLHAWLAQDNTETVADYRAPMTSPTSRPSTQAVRVDDLLNFLDVILG